jgi:imidazolonepropionase-like amidohydrolase
MSFRSSFASLLVLIPAAALGWADPPALIAIRNARLVPVSGPVIERGTIVLRDGLIEAVGANATPPPGAWVVEGAGLTVYPGLIDAVSGWGIPESGAAPAPAGGRGGQGAAPPAQAAPARSQGPEDRPATQSWLRAADLVRTTDRRLDAARAAGFTTAVTFPKQGLVAGNGAVVSLGGERHGEMVIHPSAGLYLTTSPGGLSSGFPNSLFGVTAYWRQLWLDAAHYKMAMERYAQNPQAVRRPAYDRALEGVLAAPRVLVPAVSYVQIERMIRVASDLKTPFVIYGAHEGYRAADLLKKAGVPVIVSLRWPAKARDGDPEEEEDLRVLELRDKAPSTPGVLDKAGVRFAFSADGLETPREAVRAVKRAIDAGLSRDAALRALTVSAAEIFGVADRLGSLERGKIANLIVVKGDLFDERPQVQMIFVDGVKYDPAPETPAGADAGPGGPRRFGAPPDLLDDSLPRVQIEKN